MCPGPMCHPYRKFILPALDLGIDMWAVIRALGDASFVCNELQTWRGEEA